MDLDTFFVPVSKEEIADGRPFQPDEWGTQLKVHDNGFPELEGCTIALVGIRMTEEEDPFSMQVRKWLYRLRRKSYAATMLDAGDLLLDDDREKNCQSLGYVISELLLKNIMPVLIGGPQYLVYGQYLAFQYMKEFANLVCFDNRFAFEPEEAGTITDENYLQRMTFSANPYIFNFSILGYQGYFVDAPALEALEKLYFDHYRLGNVRADLKEIEPVIRAADFMSFNVSAVRQSDSPAGIFPSPNGFTGEEACALARYAGLSDSLRCISFGGVDLLHKNRQQTAHLLAQMIWYFADGTLNHIREEPISGDPGFTRFITTIHKEACEIIFYKSNRTGRWWMEIPLDNHNNRELPNKHVIPCTYTDYQHACNDEMPERWWQTFKKLN
ncbi:MAG: hypothetical protein WD077_12735 [Bacteroidia bacterium]